MIYKVNSGKIDANMCYFFEKDLILKIFSVHLNQVIQKNLKNLIYMSLFLVSIFTLGGCQIFGGSQSPILVCGTVDADGNFSISEEENQIGIYSIIPKGADSNGQLITNPEFPAYSPIISPDSQKVVYASITRDLDGNGEIQSEGDLGEGLYVSDLNGEDVIELVYLENDRFKWVNWSLDSQTLAYQTEVDPNIVFIINVDGSGGYQIPIGDFSNLVPNYLPLVSPNKVHRIWPQADSGFAVLDVTATEAEINDAPLITDELSEYWFIGWSPDSSQILLFTEDEEAAALPRVPSITLYVINTDGSGLTQITDLGAAGTYVGAVAKWSPDGKQIAYLSNIPDSEGNLPGFGTNPGLFVVSSRGGGSTLLQGDDMALSFCLSWYR